MTDPDQKPSAGHFDNMMYNTRFLPRTDIENGFDVQEAVLKANARTKKWIAYSVVFGSFAVLAITASLVGLYLSGDLKQQQQHTQALQAGQPTPNGGSITGGLMGGKSPTKSLDGHLNALGGAIPTTISPPSLDTAILIAAHDTDIVDNIKDTVSDISDGLSDTAETISDIHEDAVDALHDVGDTLEDTVSDIGDNVDDFLDSGNDAMDEAGDVLEDIGDMHSDIHDHMEDGLESIGEELFENMAENAEEISDVLEDIFDAGTDVNDITEDMLDNVEDAFDDNFGDADFGEDTIGEAIDDRFSSLGESLNDVVEDSLGDGTDIADGFSDVIDNVGDTIGDLNSEIVDNAGDFLDNFDTPDIASDTLDSASDVVETIADEMTDLSENVGEGISELADAVSELDDGYGILPLHGNYHNNAASNNVMHSLLSMHDIGLINGGQGFLSLSGKEFVGNASTMPDLVLDGIVGVGASMDNMHELFGDMLEDLSDTFDSVTDAVNDVIENSDYPVIDIEALTHDDAVSETIEELSDIASDALGDILDASVPNLHEDISLHDSDILYVSDILGDGSDILEDIPNTVENLKLHDLNTALQLHATNDDSLISDIGPESGKETARIIEGFVEAVDELTGADISDNDDDNNDEDEDDTNDDEDDDNDNVDEDDDNDNDDNDDDNDNEDDDDDSDNERTSEDDEDDHDLNDDNRDDNEIDDNTDDNEMTNTGDLDVDIDDTDDDENYDEDDDITYIVDSDLETDGGDDSDGNGAFDITDEINDNDSDVNDKIGELMSEFTDLIDIDTNADELLDNIGSDSFTESASNADLLVDFAVKFASRAAPDFSIPSISLANPGLNFNIANINVGSPESLSTVTNTLQNIIVSETNSNDEDDNNNGENTEFHTRDGVLSSMNTISHILSQSFGASSSPSIIGPSATLTIDMSNTNLPSRQVNVEDSFQRSAFSDSVRRLSDLSSWQQTENTDTSNEEDE